MAGVWEEIGGAAAAKQRQKKLGLLAG